MKTKELSELIEAFFNYYDKQHKTPIDKEIMMRLRLKIIAECEKTSIKSDIKENLSIIGNMPISCLPLVLLDGTLVYNRIRDLKIGDYFKRNNGRLEIAYMRNFGEKRKIKLQRAYCIFENQINANLSLSEEYRTTEKILKYRYTEKWEVLLNKLAAYTDYLYELAEQPNANEEYCFKIPTKNQIRKIANNPDRFIETIAPYTDLETLIKEKPAYVLNRFKM